MMRFASTIVVSLLAAGCSLLPFEPGNTYTVHGRELMDPPPESYRDIAHNVKVCVRTMKEQGIPGPFRDVNFDRVRWFRSAFILRDDGVTPGGINNAEDLWIIIQEDYLEDARVIAHEWLHLETYPYTHGQGIFLACDPFRLPID